MHVSWRSCTLPPLVSPPSALPSRESMHVSWRSCTLSPMFLRLPPFPPGKVCMFPGVRAHFPLCFSAFRPSLPGKYACFPAFVHTFPLVPPSSALLSPESMHVFRRSRTLSPLFLRLTPFRPGKVCMFPGVRAHFPELMAIFAMVGKAWNYD